MAVSILKNDFNSQKEWLINKRKNFSIHHKRGTKMVYVKDSAVAIQKTRNSKAVKDDKLNKEIINLIANVSKNINNFCVKSNFEIESEEERHSSTWSNRDLYESLDVGTEFYYIDIAHCFWRIAYLKGYITPTMYESILGKPHLKTYRNMALACIVAPSSRDYYVHGEKILSVTEDRTLQRIIYDNIRFSCYNLMGDITTAIGQELVIGYRTDGIMVLPEAKNEVIQLIMEQDFHCTEKKIIKSDNYFYKYLDGTQKHF